MAQLIEAYGEVLEFPDGMSQDEIVKVIQAQFGTEQLEQPEVDPNAMLMSAAAGNAPRPLDEQGNVADSIRNSDIYNFLRENAEIPAGVAGSIAGGAMMAPLGPVAAVGGAVVGGAAGSAGGSLLSDAALGEELDWAKAVEEAAWSAGFDIATLGLGKLGKAGWAALRGTGKTASEVVEELAKRSGAVPKAGTPQSLAQTQQTLTEGGATLTTAQTGKASPFVEFREQMAREGLLSGRTMEKNANAVNEIAQRELDNLLGGPQTKAMMPAELGEAVYETISQGKRLMGDIYDKSVKEVTQAISGKRVDTSKIAKTMENYVDRMRTEFAIDLDKTTLDVINKQLGYLDNLPNGTMKAEDLLKFEGMLRKEISAVGTFGSDVYNKTASRELAELSSQVRDSIASAIGQVDPKAAAKYLKAKNAYAKGIDELLPEINSKMLSQASKDSFDQIGTLLTSAGSVSKVKALMNSINRAYSTAKQAGKKDLPFASAAEARTAVKQSYLADLFKGVDGETLDIANFKTLAKSMEVPKKAERMQAILGNDYVATKRLMNLMSDASTKPSSNIGTLALRSKEFGVGGAVIGTSGYFGGPVGALGGAAVVFGIPKLWAIAATNKKTVNKLLAFQAKEFSSESAMSLAASNLVLDLAKENPEVQEILSEYGIDLNTEN